MFIKTLNLKNFKRFSDLTIDLSNPENDDLPKLVLLIGANGSGKSSVFDAFETINTITKQPNFPFTTASGLISGKYYSKNSNTFCVNIEFNSGFVDLNQLNYNDTTYNTSLKSVPSFYGRSAFRYTPDITKTTIGTTASAGNDSDRPKKYTDFDTSRLVNDLDTFVVLQLEALNQENPSVKTEFNKRFNQAFENIFGYEKGISLNYVGYKTPADGKPFQFFFKKGDSDFDYNLLSAGEKMVFELLFNLYSRSSLYQDSIVFLDEIDLHLNTSLQASLLKEITENWIPEKSQLWVASHSLGFIDYARKYDRGAIIDFDSLDFDTEKTLKPKQADEFDVYDVVFGSKNQYLIDFIKSNTVKTFVCEGSNVEIFSKYDLNKVVFTDKFGKDKTYKRAVINISDNEGLFGLIDKDYLTDLEVEKLKSEHQRLYILEYYCLENYLYHPKNILEKYPTINVGEYKNSIIDLKNEKIDYLVSNIALSRNTYKILDDQESLIKKILESDDFDVFYPYLDINKIDKSSLISKYKLTSESELANSNWIESEIQKILTDR